MTPGREMPLSQATADAFAAEWIAAWNAQDLDLILSHYADDIVFASPFALEFAGGQPVVEGKEALRAYWTKALAGIPELRFVLEHAVPGTNSVSLVYQSVRNLRAVETMVFDETGLVTRVYCHYQPRD